MSLVLIPSLFRFGIMNAEELPELPSGFRWLMSKETFVQVIGPDGRKWYLQMDAGSHLVLCETATQEDVERTKNNEFGGLKLGQEFIDDHVKIELPNVLTSTPPNL